MAPLTGKNDDNCMSLKIIYLQVFTHGQLYVACSRVGNPADLKFALIKSGENGQIEKAKNVVYREILLNT